MDLEDEERPGQPQKVKDEELEELLEENPFRTQSELRKALRSHPESHFHTPNAKFCKRTEFSCAPHNRRTKSLNS